MPDSFAAAANTGQYVRRGYHIYPVPPSYLLISYVPQTLGFDKQPEADGRILKVFLSPSEQQGPPGLASGSPSARHQAFPVDGFQRGSPLAQSLCLHPQQTASRSKARGRWPCSRCGQSAWKASRASHCLSDASLGTQSSAPIPAGPAPGNHHSASWSCEFDQPGTVYKWNHPLPAFLCLTSFTQHRVLQVHPYCRVCQNFLPLLGNNIPVYIPHFVYPFLPPGTPLLPPFCYYEECC